MILKRNGSYLRPEPKPLKTWQIVLLVIACVLAFGLGYFAVRPVWELMGVI